jgi:enterochelin esterase family protein
MNARKVVEHKKANHYAQVKRAFLTLWACGLALTQSFGQSSPQARIDKAVFSPEVHADRTVTFRFFAPNAKAVFLEREGAKRATLTEDEKGVWSFTTEPLAPDYYVYSYVVDRVQLADPANPLLKTIVTGGSESIVHVPGPNDLLWETADVSHGTLHKHTTHSNVLGEDRSFWVYTPPGYAATEPKPYPVLYLLHGVMEDATAWISAGRANIILDNLIARGQTTPMILVMPLSYGFADPADHVGDLFSLTTDQKKIMDMFASTLFNEIMPEVEHNYRVDKTNQAVAGISMGGAQALYIGLGSPGRFNAIGAFSPAVIMYSSRERFFPSLDVKKIEKIKLLTISCGKEDFLYKPVQIYRDWLKTKGVAVTSIDTPGNHTWLVWRRNLIDFALKLFR